MRSVQLHLTIPGRPSAEVYQALSDLGADLGWAPDPVPLPDGGDPKGWEIGLPYGLLQWVTDSEPGDVEHPVSVFDGSWSCVDDGPATAVTFAAHLDVALSHGDAETLAVRSFLDDAVSLVAGMFDGALRVDDVVIQPTPPSALSVA